MISISSNLNSRKFQRDLERQIQKKAEDKISKIVRGAICPTHGRSATVRFKGVSRSGQLNFSINSCCDENIKRATNRLK